MARSRVILCAAFLNSKKSHNSGVSKACFQKWQTIFRDPRRQPGVLHLRNNSVRSRTLRGTGFVLTNPALKRGAGFVLTNLELKKVLNERAGGSDRQGPGRPPGRRESGGD